MATTKEYTFQNVTVAHTIRVNFEAIIMDVTIRAKVTTANVTGVRNAGSFMLKTQNPGDAGWDTYQWFSWQQQANDVVTSDPATDTTKSVSYGGGLTVWAETIPTGYSFDHWEDANGTTLSRNAEYTISNVTADTTVYAVYSGEVYQITTSHTGSGTISPTSANVCRGADQTFTITAGTGYEISTIYVDGQPIPLE